MRQKFYIQLKLEKYLKIGVAFTASLPFIEGQGHSYVISQNARNQIERMQAHSVKLGSIATKNVSANHKA